MGQPILMIGCGKDLVHHGDSLSHVELYAAFAGLLITLIFDCNLRAKS